MTEDEISVGMRLTLLEERLNEGFKATNTKLDAIMHGETINCTLHRTRMDSLEHKAIELDTAIKVVAADLAADIEKKASDKSFKTLMALCIFVLSILGGAVIKHVWF